MKSVFVTFLVFIVLLSTAFGIGIKPVNFSSPSAGGVFSFDFIVTEAPSQPAQGIQLTIASVAGTGLDFNSPASKAVKDNSQYWILNNSSGTEAFPSGSSFVFGDGANEPSSETMQVGDIIARFAFNWDGIPDSYTFNMNLNNIYSYAYLENYSKESVILPAGQWFTSPITSATASSFTVNLVPEPMSMTLLGLGSLALLRRYRR